MEADFPADTDTQIAEAAEALRSMPEIQPSSWEALAPNERLAVLRRVEATLARVQQRPAVEVYSEPIGRGVYGYFDGERIVISAEQLRGAATVEELVDTVVHEGRHAYQQYAVEHPGVITDERIRDAWTANMAPGGYLSAEEFGQRRYESQPVEADAWSYAGRIREALYGE